MSEIVENEQVYLTKQGKDWSDYDKQLLPVGTKLLVVRSDMPDSCLMLRDRYGRTYCIPRKYVRKQQDKKKSTWNPLTVEELQQVCDTMPGGIESFCKGWGWLQFAQEVEKICREKNS